MALIQTIKSILYSLGVNVDFHEKDNMPAPTVDVKSSILEVAAEAAINKIVDFTNSRNWEYIVIHHSATVDEPGNDWEGIRRYHMSWRYNGDIITEEKAKELTANGIKGVQSPWPSIAYSFGIEKVDGEYIYQKGCPLSEIGYHAKQMNPKGFGICMVGDFDNAPPSDVQINMLVSLLKFLMAHYNISKEKVLGHRETYALFNVPVEKTCPGNKFSMDALRAKLV
jgi:hypothetical protein